MRMNENFFYSMPVESRKEMNEGKNSKRNERKDSIQTLSAAAVVVYYICDLTLKIEINNTMKSENYWYQKSEI